MKLTVNTDKMVSLSLAMLAAYAVTMLPMEALAAGGDAEDSALAKILCNVVEWFQGSIGAGIATLAIIVIGVGALMGKVSWGMAIIVGLGVGIIFGAPSIVASLGGTKTCGASGDVS